MQNEELRKWADRCEEWTKGRSASSVRTFQLIDSGVSDETKELCGVLRRLQAHLEGGNVEQRIAKMPDTTRLLSRLLRLDSVLCSEAAEPLLGCMVCLVPGMAGPSQSEVTSTAGRKILAMREKCGEWCRERLHAAVQGIGDDAGFGASACGFSLSVDLLYDCGLSHGDMLASVTAEASRDMDEMLARHDGPCSGGQELAAVGALLMGVSHASCGTGESQAASHRCGRACVKSSSVRWQSVGITPSSLPSAWQQQAPLGDMVHIDELSVLRRVEVVLETLGSQVLLPESEVHSLVQAACLGASKAPWVSLALEQGLEGALRCLERFHPNVALALSLLPHTRNRGGGWGDEVVMELSSERGDFGSSQDVDWLWREWSKGGETSSEYGPAIDSDPQQDDAADDAWPRACSAWYWHGPDALINVFDASAQVTLNQLLGVSDPSSPPHILAPLSCGGQPCACCVPFVRAHIRWLDGQKDGEEACGHLWTAVKVLCVRNGARGAGMSTAMRLYNAWNEEAGIVTAASQVACGVGGVVAAARRGWVQARGVALVTVAALLGSDGCSRAQRSGLVGMLEEESLGVLPPSLALTVLHVLRVGMGRVVRMHRLGGGGLRDRLEALWRVYVRVLSCSIAGEPAGCEACKMHRKSHAVQAVAQLQGCGDLHADAVGFARGMRAHGV